MKNICCKPRRFFKKREKGQSSSPVESTGSGFWSEVSLVEELQVAGRQGLCRQEGGGEGGREGGRRREGVCRMAGCAGCAPPALPVVAQAGACIARPGHG